MRILYSVILYMVFFSQIANAWMMPGLVSQQEVVSGGGDSALYTAATVIWDFENDATDTKGTHNLANCVNAPSFGTTSPPQGTYYAVFDDANTECFTIADHNDLDMDGGDFTIAFWQYADTVNRLKIIDKLAATGGYQIRGNYVVDGNYISVDLQDSSGNLDTYVRATAIGTAQWECYVISYATATNTLTVYATTTTGSWSMENGTTDVLAYDSDANAEALVVGVAAGTYHSGYIDELVLWKGKTLDSTEAANFRDGNWR